MSLADIDCSKYKMNYDYHTHTVFSHGKGTIEENVKSAVNRGLAAVAITDHGPGHLLYGIKRSDVKEMRREIERLKPLYPKIEIYLGVEANIIEKGSCLDVTIEECLQYDFILAGYHYGVTNGNCIRNWCSETLDKKSKGNSKVKYDSRSIRKLRNRNTDMTVKALYENEVKILTHPADKGPFDIVEIAKACEANNTLMEISTWHAHLTVEEIKLAALTDARFIISSDAHRPERIGDFEGGLIRAFEAGLDIERIVNIKERV